MDAVTYVIWHTDSVGANEETIRKIGGKALGLHELKKLGANVPAWATITADLFRALCDSDRKLSQILSEERNNLEKAKIMRRHIKDLSIGAKEEKFLINVWDTLSRSGKRPIAVRSSATDEDSETLSFAGQMDSFLNIRSIHRFLQSVRSCWASLFGDRAVLYRVKNGIDPWSPQIAVIVQEMVDSEISGVVFTANPLSGNREQMLMSSVWGLGEGIVSGTLNADTFIVDAQGSVIKQTIVEKKESVRYDSHSGTAMKHVPVEKQSIPSLEGDHIKNLHRIATTIQEFKNMPMDIEFGISGQKIYILQARPITSLKEYREPSGENYLVWDNSNIVESYAGVTTPLTFSFIKKAYYAAYWQFCEVLGVDRKTIFESRYIFENMLGLIEGRVYYNLINWYRLISLIPGFRYNRSFMEQMMGLQVIKEYVKVEKPKGVFEKYFVQLPKLLKVGLRMIIVHLTLQKRVDRFHSHFDSVYEKYSKFDFDNRPPSELLEISRYLEDEILWNWKAPILNDLEAMIFYGTLSKLTDNWGLDETKTLHNDLLCGEGGIRSTKVVTELFEIAITIDQDKELKSDILEASPEKALLRIQRDPRFSAVREAFTRYLENYGVRSIEEMKLESTPIRDDPRFCVAMIQNYLRSSVPDPQGQRSKELTIRSKAEEQLKKRLRRKRILGIIPRIFLYRWVLKHTRNAIRNRENQRFARAEAYALTRSIVRAVGKYWAERGIINSPDDIFYLEWEEIWSYVKGTATCTDLKGMIRLRKAEFDQYLTSSPDDHIETHGDVYSNKLFSAEKTVSMDESVLEGLGCCAGIVEQEVRVVLKPDMNLKLQGEIMVAKQTDPGWVVLFPSISGLIVEKGSMLSHSAIVAREMGIPAVVGVKNATKKLQSGDRVRLDGAAGKIEILSRGNP